jgi:hypothetical protein
MLQLDNRLSNSSEAKPYRRKRSNSCISRRERSWSKRAMCNASMRLSQFVEIYMDNFATCYSCLSTVAIVPRSTIFSWVTLWIEASIMLRRSCCCWPIRYATPIELLSFAEITSAVKLQKSMDFMKSVSGNTRR